MIELDLHLFHVTLTLSEVKGKSLQEILRHRAAQNDQRRGY